MSRSYSNSDLGNWKKLKSLRNEGVIDDEEYFSFLDDYETYLEEELSLKEKEINNSIVIAVEEIIENLYPNGYKYKTV